MQLAVIPARGGSKRIPRKNIKMFHGQPMIAWSIQAAIDSGCFDEVWVSTDDEEIAAIAQAYGAKVPFLRPAHLSNDFATTADVMAHAVEEFDKLNHVIPDYVCCLYATAPFINSKALKKGLELMPKYQYALAITEYQFPIQRSLKKDINEGLYLIEANSFVKRSQDLDLAYHDAGQFCWGWAKSWLNKEQIFSVSTGGVILPKYLVQDIDDEQDWKRAEMIFEVFKRNQHYFEYKD